MSNHEIGHVMDIAIKGILDLYDEGAFSAATARKLIKTNCGSLQVTMAILMKRWKR